VKNVLRRALPIFLGVCLFSFLIHFKILSQDQIIRGLRDPRSLLLNCTAVFLIILLVTWRWTILLRARSVQASPQDALIGIVVSSVAGQLAIGSLGGDFLRTAWIIKKNPESRRGAIESTVLDRVLGVAGIFAIVSLGLIALKVPLWIVGAASCLGALALRKLWAEKSKHAGLHFAWTTAFISILLSTLSLFATVLLYYLQLRILGTEVPFAYLLVTVPLAYVAGFLVSVPFGIGIHQTVFAIVFSQLGSFSTEVVAATTLIQGYNILSHFIAAGLLMAFVPLPSKAS
jgi:uncharacterized membrane protein YbhN (UPF0104 family)